MAFIVLEKRGHLGKNQIKIGTNSVTLPKAFIKENKLNNSNWVKVHYDREAGQIGFTFHNISCTDAYKLPASGLINLSKLYTLLGGQPVKGWYDYKKKNIEDQLYYVITLR